MSAFYKLESRPLTKWGDYGSILQNGMSMHLRRREGKIALERTGPFVPPITTPFDIILTEEARQLLNGSGLSGVPVSPH